jgi:hypothetical protein
VKELEKLYSEKLLNLDKFSLKFKKCRNILKTRKYAYRKRLQSEIRINEESKNAPMTAAERMRRMRQRRQVEASTSRADAETVSERRIHGHGSN